MNAVLKILEAQIDETPVETRIAKLESDVGHIKVSVQNLEAKAVAANDAIAALGSQVAVVSATMATKADVSRLEAQTKGDLARLEEKQSHVATKADVARLEENQSHLATKADLARLEENQSHFATKADLAQMRVDLVRLEEKQSHLATKAELNKLEGEMKTGFGRLEERIEGRVNAAERTMIQWFLTTAIATVALVLGIPALFDGGADADAATTAADPPSPIKEEAPLVPKPQ
jgi:hypothetical protein